MFWISWLYSVSIVFSSESWPYQLFYGVDGNVVFVWLFVMLLPALLFLILKASGRKFVSRLTGAAGFYCLLGNLISAHGFLFIRA